ncbi:MAG: zinc ABC transporter substrate-binding protein, partial [Bacilli bacterium]|nr:zinc ABC transporter substrate-binding protein [Bacilli bacterium]
MKKLLLIFLAVFTAVSMSSCNQTTSDNKMIVAVSIVPQAAFVEAVAGDLVDIITLIPPGYSPANYEPNAQTMAELSNAAVYFTIGVPTESGNILPDIDTIHVVHLETVVSQTYQDRYFGESKDPHIWLSIKRVKVMVQEIAD